MASARPAVPSFCLGEESIADDTFDMASEFAALGSTPAFEFMTECGQQDSDISVVIEHGRPNKMLQVSPEWLAEFDFASHEAIGRTLALIQGPMTNRQELDSVIEAVRWGKRAELITTFYSRNGQPALYVLRAQGVDMGNSRDHAAYMLSFIKCETVSWKKATIEDGLAKAVVHIAEPFRAAHVSSKLCEMYNLAPREMLGRTLNIIHGPNTDLGKWMTLLRKGQRGYSSRGVIMTSTRACREICAEVSIVPVCQAMGEFLHLLIIFSPVEAADGRPDNCLSGRLATDAPVVEPRALPHKPRWGSRAQHREGIALNAGCAELSASPRTCGFDTMLAGSGSREQAPYVGAAPMGLNVGAAPMGLNVNSDPGIHVSEYSIETHDLESLYGADSVPRAPSLADFERAAMSGSRHSLPAEHYALSRRSALAAPYHPPAHLAGRSAFECVHEAGRRAQAASRRPIHGRFSSHDSGVDLAHAPSAYGMEGGGELEGLHQARSGMDALHRSQPSVDAVHYVGSRFDLHPHLVVRTHPVLHSEPATFGCASEPQPPMVHLVHMGYGSEIGTEPQQQMEDVVSTVIPRRKKKEGTLGMPQKSVAKPVKIALDVLDKLSFLSLSQAADTLGISSTAMKKSCRKLGVTRWPYKSDQPTGGVCQIDDAYVRKIQRKYSSSLKKGTSKEFGAACGGKASLSPFAPAGSGRAESFTECSDDKGGVFTPDSVYEDVLGVAGMDEGGASV